MGNMNFLINTLPRVAIIPCRTLFRYSYNLTGNIQGLSRNFTAITTKTEPMISSSTTGNTQLQFTRTRVAKYNFYRPSALKRMRKHGLKKRLSNVGGLKMFWRKYLKGRHIWHT